MLLSVIVPVYNAEKYLPRCLDSLLAQGLSEEEMEIVCVDDGSRDGSSDILYDYSRAHSCISVYSQENAGAGVARNLGLEHSKGEVVTFCDADDYLIPEGLGSVIQNFWTEDVDVICHASTTLDAMKLKSWREDNNVRGVVVCEGDGRKVYERDPKYFVWNTLIRRSFIEKHHLRFPPLRMTEDSCFMLELMMLKPRTLDISANIYRYTVNKEQVTKKRDPKLMRLYIEDYWHFLSRLRDYKLSVVFEFQKKPFYSRVLSAAFQKEEYGVWSDKARNYDLCVLPYPCYRIMSYLYRHLFVPYVLPRLGRG